MHITLTRVANFTNEYRKCQNEKKKKIIQTKLALFWTALHEYEVFIPTTLLHHNLLYVSKHYLHYAKHTKLHDIPPLHQEQNYAILSEVQSSITEAIKKYGS